MTQNSDNPTDPKRNRNIKNILYKNIQKLYNIFVRNHLPRTWETYNGVEVHKGRLLDQKTDHPEYELDICNQIHKFIEEGMEVTIIGDKYGIKTVHAGQVIGDQGKVYYFDGNGRSVELTRDSILRNDFPPNIEMKQAVVGQPLSREAHNWGGVINDSGAEQMDIEHLPATDALILNLGGPELLILSNLSHQYEIIITKTYNQLIPGFHSAVIDLLECSGYEISQVNWQSNHVGVVAARLI